jgi:hypothetical protein
MYNYRIIVSFVDFIVLLAIFFGCNADLSSENFREIAMVVEACTMGDLGYRVIALAK